VVPGETVGVEAYDPGCLDVDWPWQLELADGFARARGPGGGCRIVAEAGVNHNGDLDLALALVDAAAEAGADAVKFQTFDPVRLVSAAAPMAPYQTRNTGASTSQREMLDALALPREWHRPLMERCAERGIGFLSSPFDEGSSDFLAELGVSALKLPSGEITNLGLLDHVATLGLPVILSTGMSTLGEVMDAVERLAAGSVPALTLLHCVSDYPTRPGDANLRAMDTLRSVFEVPVGWSDHTPGWSVAVAAAARGAALIEKHLTLDRGLPGPDHAASLEPDELGRLVAAVREAERALGDGVKRPREAEVPVARVARKSLHLRRAVAAGAVIGRGDLVALRPGTGVPPGQMASMVGRRARVDLAAGALLSPGDLEPRADAPGRGEGGEPEGSDGTGSGGAGDGG
jgi:N-acetylneuraminate synthase